ncbi:MAG: TolC family protein [Deltaproteobacteria bacterium]
MPRYIWLWPCLLLMLAAPAFCEAQQTGSPLSLDQAVSMALTKNPAIHRATEDLASSQEKAKAVRAQNLPRLSASYSYTRLKENPYAIFNGNKVLVGDRNDFAWDLTLAQPLFTGFALTAKTRMAELGVELGKVDRQLAVLDLTERVRLAYYKIFQQKQLLQVAEETVTQLAAHEKDASHFYDQGLIPYNDLLKSQVALSTAKQDRLQSRSDLEMAVARLNTLLHQPMEQPTEIIDPKASPGSLPDLGPLVEEAKANRPESRALRLALDKSNQQIRLAKSSYYPEVDLEGRYVRNGDNPPATNNDYANDHNASIGVKATWTFFEWGRKRAQVNSQLHAQKALASQLEQIKDTISLQVKQSWLHLKVTLANIQTSEEARKQAEENFRITRLQYQKSLATSSDVLDARTMLSQAEAKASNNIYGCLSARAELDRAIGLGARIQ